MIQGISLRETLSGMVAMQLAYTAYPVMPLVLDGRVKDSNRYEVTRYERVGGMSNTQAVLFLVTIIAMVWSALPYLGGGSPSTVTTPYGVFPLPLVLFGMFIALVLVMMVTTEEPELVEVTELTPLGAYRVACLGASGVST